MSRPMAADGTIRYSTPSAQAGAPVIADTVHRPAPSTGASRASSIARIRLNARLIINLSRCRPVLESAPAHITRVVVNHIDLTAGVNHRVRKRLTAATPRGSPPSGVVRVRSPPTAGSGGRRGAQDALQVRLHGLQLLAPVGPVVSTALREVEHRV